MMITAELSTTVVCAVLSDMSTRQQPKSDVPMTSYKVITHPDAGYDVHVIGADGARQTMLGFETEADAQSWIGSDKARDDLRLKLR